jgi:tetratricopeptide (TPR) repeat protein
MKYQVDEISIGDANEWVVDSTVYPTQNTTPNLGYQVSDEMTALTIYMPDFRRDALFFEALRQMQQGAWPKALKLFEMLKVRYPEATDLDALMMDATLRIQLEDSWGSKVQAKQHNWEPWRLVMRIVPLVLVVVLIIGGFLYYTRVQQLRAFNSARQALGEQAQDALRSGQFQQAIDLFNQLLVLDPADASAQQSKAAAARQLDLQNRYDTGVAAVAAADVALAVKLFTEIQNEAPGYRDVAQFLDRLSGALRVQEVFLAGQNAHQAGKWTDAIFYFESLRQIDSTYEEQSVVARLVEAYLNASKSIVAQSPDEGADLPKAQEYLRRTLKLRIDEPTAKMESDLLEIFFSGKQATLQGNFSQAVDRWRLLYDQRPGYLNGYLAEQLYHAYLKLGVTAMQAGNFVGALDLYNKAAALAVRDNSQALNGAHEVALLLTPTPTPTLTPAPVPTATPTPRTLAMYSGWILFSSIRNGQEGLYVMRPDGSDQQMAPDEAYGITDQIYEREMWSPDQKSRIYVTKPPNSETGSQNVDIFKRREDLPSDWNRDYRLTEFPGLDYDPVWSPNNEYIAFVSTTSGNDEIWVMDTEGRNHKQLTFNDWPWDKHPTISPQGDKIAFYSNRTGKRQIFITNPDGSNQINISNNEHDDWNPLWLR